MRKGLGLPKEPKRERERQLSLEERKQHQAGIRALFKQAGATEKEDN
jgi:hypothetical protein